MTFFSFGSKLSSKTLQVHPVYLSTFRDQKGHFPEDRLILGDYRNIEFPVQFEYDSGSKAQDILDTGWPSLFLISDQLGSFLSKQRLIGWQTFPVEVFLKKGEQLERYAGFSVTGRCGPLDYSKSQIIQKRLVEGGSQTNFYKGQYFDVNTWDGNDFFISQSSFGIIITERAATLLMKEKFSNLKLQNLEHKEVMVWK